MNQEALLQTLLTRAAEVGMRLLAALLLAVIAFRMIRLFGRKIERAMEKRNTDKTIARTVTYVFGVGLRAVVILALVGYVGIDTSGLTALLASLGVGIGLAVNGALGNLAGGVLIVLTRPFRIDDFIEVGEHTGTVEEIHITYTRLCTPDNKIIYIPNGALSTDTIVNYS